LRDFAEIQDKIPWIPQIILDQRSIGINNLDRIKSGTLGAKTQAPLLRTA
jgi:hypothetical protein